HWLFEGKCAVHENSPFGCAFFDVHMTPEEAKRRQDATIKARRRDAATGGLYHRVWLHLHRLGLVARPADHAALHEEIRALHRHADRRSSNVIESATPIHGNTSEAV